MTAKDVDYPETFEDMLDAAKDLHDPDNNVVGYLARGMKNANVPVWTHLMQGWDMDPISPDGTFNTRSPEAVEAATFYQSLFKDVSAAGASGFNWNECQSAFALGQGAMWQDGIGFATPMEDENESRWQAKWASASSRRDPWRSTLRCSVMESASRRSADKKGASILLLSLGNQQGQFVACSAGRSSRPAAYICA